MINSIGTKVPTTNPTEVVNNDNEHQPNTTSSSKEDTLTNTIGTQVILSEKALLPGQPANKALLAKETVPCRQANQLPPLSFQDLLDPKKQLKNVSPSEEAPVPGQITYKPLPVKKAVPSRVPGKQSAPLSFKDLPSKKQPKAAENTETDAPSGSDEFTTDKNVKN